MTRLIDADALLAKLNSRFNGLSKAETIAHIENAPTVQREVDKDMAKEYMEWIDFFHAGNGDYSYFLKSKGLVN